MRFLADANVLSEVTKPDPNSSVIEWLRENEEEIAVDPIVLGELRYGILVLPYGRRRKRLEEWFEEGVRKLHCLPWDVECGNRWAELLAGLRGSGKAMPIKDSLIAATALAYRLVVVTRNRNDFEAAGVELLNPFSEKR